MQQQGDWDTQLPEQKGGDFVKLNDGDAIVFGVVGKPYFFAEKWNDATGRSELAKDGKPKVAFCLYDVAAKQQKILRISANTFRDLQSAMADFPPASSTYKLSRKGSTLTDTRYTVMPSKPLSKDDIAAIKALEPFDLPAALGHTTTASVDAGATDDDGLPF